MQEIMDVGIRRQLERISIIKIVFFMLSFEFLKNSILMQHCADLYVCPRFV